MRANTTNILIGVEKIKNDVILSKVEHTHFEKESDKTIR